MTGRPAWIVAEVNSERFAVQPHKVGHGHMINGADMVHFLFRDLVMTPGGIVSGLSGGNPGGQTDPPVFQQEKFLHPDFNEDPADRKHCPFMPGPLAGNGRRAG